VTLGPAAFDRHVFSLDEAGLIQSLENWAAADFTRVGGRRENTEETDHRHRLLLRGGNARQRYRAAKQGNEAPTVHSILLQATIA
jgi:hypothetical protein